jgi:hypothetical protein
MRNPIFFPRFKEGISIQVCSACAIKMVTINAENIQIYKFKP